MPVNMQGGQQGQMQQGGQMMQGSQQYPQGNNMGGQMPQGQTPQAGAASMQAGMGEDQYQVVKKTLVGKWVDQNANWMSVAECNPEVQNKLSVQLDSSGQQIAEFEISQDVYSLPIEIAYRDMSSGKSYFMKHNPGFDKYGTWMSQEDADDSWVMRRPAVIENPQNTSWPDWAEFVLIEIAGHADMGSKEMGIAAIICAVSNVPTSGKVHGEQFWKGHMSFGPKDFSDDTEAQVNVPLATIAAVVFGLKAVLDLREKIGGDKIKGVFISSDHTVVETAIEGQTTTPYLEPIAKLLQAYKTELLDDDHFPNCFNFAVSKIQASANKAAKLAKEARQFAQDDEYPACSMGDIELYEAVMTACEQAARDSKKTGAH